VCCSVCVAVCVLQCVCCSVCVAVCVLQSVCCSACVAVCVLQCVWLAIDLVCWCDDVVMSWWVDVLMTWCPHHSSLHLLSLLTHRFIYYLSWLIASSTISLDVSMSRLWCSMCFDVGCVLMSWWLVVMLSWSVHVLMRCWWVDVLMGHLLIFLGVLQYCHLSLGVQHTL